MLDCDLLHKKNSERHKLYIVPKVFITKLMSQKSKKMETKTQFHDYRHNLETK